MSTINPETIDVTKPTEGEATTASVRANEQATKDNFAAAKTDIEGLESGKEDAGVAAGLVTAHDGVAGAHGGVEAAHAAHAAAANPHSDSASQTDLTAHKGSGDHDARYAPISIDGTVNEVEKDSVSQSSGRAKIDFRDTGDATVVVTDDAANDRTIVTIDASAGAGGGGIGKGTPFIVGDILEVESAAGDGAARSTGITTTTLSGHLADGAIHFTEASIDHTAIQNVGTNSHAQIDTHIADGSVHFTEASITHNNVGGRTAADAHPTSAITGLDAALAAKLENVVEDLTPELGGHLATKGQGVWLTRGDDSIRGVLIASDTFDGSGFAYSSDGSFDPANGALTVEPGRSILYGTAIQVDALTHANSAGRQVYVGQTGVLYAVDPPAAGWTDSDTDAGSYDLGTGAGAGAWVELTGLDCVIQEDVAADDRIDISCRLWTTNKTSNRSGNIELWFGLEAATPGTPDATRGIAPGFDGYVDIAFSVIASAPIAASTVVTLYARINNGDHAQYGLDLVGTVNNHEFVISVPGAGSGGGGGDVLQGVVGNDNDVLKWDNASGKVAGSAGFASTDVARLSQSNTFTGATQKVEAAGPATIEIEDTTAPADQKRFTFAAGAGGAGITAVTDVGGTRATMLGISAADEVLVGDSTVDLIIRGSNANATVPLKQNNVGLLNPGDRVDSSVGVTLSISESGSPRVILDAASPITINPPASGEGSLEVVIVNNVAVSLAGGWTAERGDDPLDGHRIAYATRLATGDTIWAWGV